MGQISLLRSNEVKVNFILLVLTLKKIKVRIVQKDYQRNIELGNKKSTD